MDSYISLIGSIVIGTLLLLSVLSFQADLRDHSFKHTNALIAQNQAMGIIEVLKWDFGQIGFGVADSTYFSGPDSNSIAFYADIGADSVIDIVRYSISDSTAASGTPNPHDKIFYRWVNDEPQTDAALGVTDFKLRYFDKDGNETNNIKNIRTIEITLEVESTLPDNNNEYARFFWREKISPPNLVY